jgi:hypothetical protein
MSHNVIDSRSESGIAQISPRNLRKLDCVAKALTLLLIPLWAWAFRDRNLFQRDVVSEIAPRDYIENQFATAVR